MVVEEIEEEESKQTMNRDRADPLEEPRPDRGVSQVLFMLPTLELEKPRLDSPNDGLDPPNSEQVGAKKAKAEFENNVSHSLLHLPKDNTYTTCGISKI